MKNSNKNQERTPPDRRLFNLIVKTDRLEVQRKLSAARDRDIAVCLSFFSDFERKMVFSFLSDAKATRIRQAMERGAGISYADYRKIIEGLINYLKPEGKTGSTAESWYRPGKRK